MRIQLALSSYPSSDPLTRCRSLSVSFDLGLRISSFDMSFSHTIRVTTPEVVRTKPLWTTRFLPRFLLTARTLSLTLPRRNVSSQ
jgi:hypothetical protein